MQFSNFFVVAKIAKFNNSANATLFYNTNSQLN